MSDSGSGPRERGGSFCKPSERAESSTSGNEDGRERTTEQKTLEGVGKVEQSQGFQTAKVEPQLQVPVSRHDLSSVPNRMPVGTAATLDMISQGMSRSSTPTMRSAYPEPPVTKSTLAELDVPRIVLNPKLRHDVNFDPDLHFRPNLDGERGKRKVQRATQFWNVLKSELQAFMEDPVKFGQEHAGTEWCLPNTLRAIGEILETLVPPEDRSAVAEIMNVEHLMQQFSKQVADLESLAGWLAKTLKMHCAPMRDDWVNEMVIQLSSGNRDRDVEMLALGLQTLMGVLEAMKLDVANHQIRCLRPLLIQDTIDFEQTFFIKKIAASKVDVSYAHSWFKAACSLTDLPVSSTPTAQPQLWSFFKGFTNCLLPTHANEGIPDVFMFDEERIIKLRAEMLDIINMELCIRLFRKVFAESQTQNDQRRAEQENQYQSTRESSFEASPTSDTFSVGSVPSLPDFNARVQASNVGTVKGRFRRSLFSNQQYFEPFGAASPESPSSSASSPSSSRSNSPLSFREPQFSQESYFPQFSGNLIPSKSQEAKLIEDINAILTDMPSSTSSNGPQATSHIHRWTMASSHLALQIVHATSHPVASYSELLPHLERILMSALSTPSSLLFAEAEQSVLHSLSPMLSHLVSSFGPMNNTRLFEVAVLPRGKTVLHSLLKEGVAFCENEEKRRVVERVQVLEVVRGMAHVGVLHWKVWSPLVYLVDPDRSWVSGNDSDTVAMELTPEPRVHADAPVMNTERDSTREERDRALKEKRRRSLKRRSLGR